MLVDLSRSATPPGLAARTARASLPFIVVGMTDGPVDDEWLALCDVVVDRSEAGAGTALEHIDANVSAHPVAATTLALLLRGQEGRSVGEGLVAESAAYSVLQAGPEFAAWRARRPRRDSGDGDDAGPRVRVTRVEATMILTLARPARLNALDALMRDELAEALSLAAATAEIERVELRGEGKAFCAGGDLDEFGRRSDPATAHVVRLERSIGRMLAQLEKSTVAYLHGACMGSGIELAAFTDWVVAAADTRIALPELGLGLIPGAGGTISLTHRIGRLRTAWLAFSGLPVDGGTAREWGLVDELVG